MIVLQSTRRVSIVAAAAAVAVLGGATAAHATFIIDPNPSNKIAVNLTDVQKKDASLTDTGTVINTNDIDITVNSLSSFASGLATIKPESDALLTTLTFAPVDPNAFGDFSFRGQDLLANQSITVTVQDNQGNAPQTFTFLEGVANQDFTREGIVSLDGETIKSVQIYNSGGFKEAKQFAFSLAGETHLPEPATWAMMLVGFGFVGHGLRKRPSVRSQSVRFTRT